MAARSFQSDARGAGASEDGALASGAGFISGEGFASGACCGGEATSALAIAWLEADGGGEALALAGAIELGADDAAFATAAGIEEDAGPVDPAAEGTARADAAGRGAGSGSGHNTATMAKGRRNAVIFLTSDADRHAVAIGPAGFATFVS